MISASPPASFAKATGRHIHLVLENGDNRASLLDAAQEPPQRQISRAMERRLSPRLARDADRRARRATTPTTRRRAWILRARSRRASSTRARSRSSGARKPRGEASGELPPATFVNFLQNHDQIGNRPLGERLESLASPRQIEAALAVTAARTDGADAAVQGEEWGSTMPFPFFCDFQGGLADAVRKGRRAEYAWAYEKYGDEVPDPLDPATPQSAVLDWTGRSPEQDMRGSRWCESCSRCRRKEIAPRLKGARLRRCRGGRQRPAAPRIGAWATARRCA